MTAVGILAMAALILASISLHEAGHMGTAKAFGMKVTRYFVGFGPTLFSRRRGETEYGVKALPLGGFVKIVGMTPQDEDADDPKAMWRFPVWKRTIVMAAGSMAHFIIAFTIFWVVAATAQLPNPDNLGPRAQTPQQLQTVAPYIAVADCVTVDLNAPRCAGTDGPARTAGLQDKDKITSVAGTPIADYAQLVDAIRGLTPGQPVEIVYERAGEVETTTLTPVAAQRPPIDDPGGEVTTVAVVGLGATYDPAKPTTVEYDAIGALPQAVDMTGQMVTGVVQAVQKFPEKIPKLWTAIAGGQRDPGTPISVVGATRIGGELVEIGDFPSFFMMLAALNMFIGLFNLLPLLPLDGGHIAISWFERARSWLYARVGKGDPGRVDYYKLMPLTYTVILIFGALTVLTVTADIVNPISILR